MRGDSSYIFVPILLALILIGIGIYVWHFRRSRRMLEDWAQQNRFQSIEARYRWLMKGPFFWTSSKGQTVYRIAVVTSDGYRHTGWARCGGWWFGLLTNKVTAVWDGQPPYSPGGFPVIQVVSVAGPEQ